MKTQYYRVLPLVAVLLWAVSVPFAHAEEDIEKRVERLEKLLEGQGLVDLYFRLEALQQEVQLLRGEAEQQTFTLNGLKQRQRDLYLDIDRRMRQLESGGRAASSSTVAPGTTVSRPSSKKPTTTASKNLAAEETAYRTAFNLLKEGRYKPAISRFREFVNKYPASGYADNAQYWLGEANYVTRAYEQAIIEFNKVLDLYPNSQKRADALLKIGYCYYELKDNARAQQALGQVSSRFPNSTAARLADKRLQKFKLERQ